jgi:hypothetical protein
MPKLKSNASKIMKKKVMDREMHKFKEGSLKSSSGQTVTNPSQAIAISLSESGQSRKKSKRGKKVRARKKI